MYAAGYNQTPADEEARPAISDPEYRWYDDVRRELGWRIVDASGALTRRARRVGGGATPTGEELTISHLERMWDATGIALSELIEMAVEPGQHL